MSQPSLEDFLAGMSRVTRALEEHARIVAASTEETRRLREVFAKVIEATPPAKDRAERIADGAGPVVETVLRALMGQDAPRRKKR